MRKGCCRASGGCAWRCPGRASRTATPGPSPPTAASSSSTPGSAARAGCASSTSPSARSASAIEDVRLVVCTHSHTDHYGLAASIVDARRLRALDAPGLGTRPPDGRRPRRGARAAGSRWRARAASRPSRWPATASRAAATPRPGSTRSSSPTASSSPGSRSRPTSASWQVHETPGHAPSHVVLHQPERKLLISGDHLLGRTVLFFDHGHTPRPGRRIPARPRRGRAARGRPGAAGARAALPRPRGEDRRGAAPGRRADRRRSAPRSPSGEKTAFEIVGEIVGAENVDTPVSAWVLQIVLSCLDHLTILGEVAPVEGTDPQRWALR